MKSKYAIQVLRDTEGNLLLVLDLPLRTKLVAWQQVVTAVGERETQTSQLGVLTLRDRQEPVAVVVETRVKGHLRLHHSGQRFQEGTPSTMARNHLSRPSALLDHARNTKRNRNTSKRWFRLTVNAADASLRVHIAMNVREPTCRLEHLLEVLPKRSRSDKPARCARINDEAVPLATHDRSV